MGKRKLTKAQRAMKQAAAEWRRMSKRKKSRYEGGFKDFAKVYIESRVKAKKKRKR